MPLLTRTSRLIVTGLLLWAAQFAPQVRAEEMFPERTTLIEEALSTFEQAAALPRSSSAEALELYRQSAKAYEDLLAQGVRNAKLYYNLGNAYYRLGDLGRAVLAYRRAQQYDPGDAQLQANLRSARSLRLNRIEEPARNRLMENLLFWHVHTSARGRAYFAVTIFSLAMNQKLLMR